MRNQSPGDKRTRQGLIARIEHAAREMNAFLLVLAIGLATLDLTCFWMFQVRDAVASATRISPRPMAASNPSAPAGDSFAAAKPARPGDNVTGF
jgi:hypothetical protein